jgi:IS30 family transposase
MSNDGPWSVACKPAIADPAICANDAVAPTDPVPRACPANGQRPAVVETLQRVGDWEGELIIERMSQSAIDTLVDSRSRYLRLVHLPAGHSAERCRKACRGPGQRP